MSANGVLRTYGEGNVPVEIPLKSQQWAPLQMTAATQTLTHSDHGGRNCVFDRAAGVVVTLPRATGQGGIFRFFVKTAVTSNSYKIAVANADDIMQGIIVSTLVGTPTTNNGWIAASTSDTITMNGTTQGGLAGDWLELEDVAPGIYAVKGIVSQSSTGATQFSAAVS